jgi:hypothetical protein
MEIILPEDQLIQYHSRKPKEYIVEFSYHYETSWRDPKEKDHVWRSRHSSLTGAIQSLEKKIENFNNTKFEGSYITFYKVYHKKTKEVYKLWEYNNGIDQKEKAI